MKRSPVYWLTCVFTILSIIPVVSATTIILPSDDALIAKSPVIVSATVVSSEPVDRNGKIWTETTLSVEHAFKGDVASTITVGEVGGIIGDRITKIWGAPEYSPGERVLAFLTPTPRGDYQTMDLLVGKFTAAETLDGARLWLRDEGAENVTMLDQTLRPIANMASQRDAGAFEQFIAARVAGRKPVIEKYTITNPVVDRPAFHESPDGGIRARDNFTMIEEPTIYRWFAFDNGGSASWVSYGTQPGYAGGGVNEIQTAMNVWNGYTSAKIAYVYSGSTTSSPGGLRAPNGRNEILFNDPLNEISGSWNPATGGVVGSGGFNGVSSRTQSWTGPFNADGTHTQKTYTAWNITEGNLTIQDNVSPTQGLSSKTLSEIVAHEFGHTLGFGHSTDNTALMYPTITGLGPGLRPDDQLAARWLYPNGTVTQPPAVTLPAAPTNLVATAGTSTIALQWSDNASNETGQYIYLSNGGSFTRVATAAAGQTTGTLSGVAAGTYRIYITAYNSAGESAASNTASVTIGSSQPALTASFTYSPSNATTDTNVSFIDQSAGSPTAWSWSFGDGTSSTAQNPVKRYTTAGTYLVTLNVSRSGASNSTSRTIVITSSLPATPPVTAAFDFNPSNPTTGTSVSFIDRSTGAPTQWTWSFGDGGTSQSQNPTHTYAGPGTYNVTLTVTNSISSNATSHAVTVAAVILPFRSLVSVAAQTNGAGGSMWRTELTLFNAGNDGASVQLTLIPPSGTVQSRTAFLSPRQAITYNNVLFDVFGISNGSGALAIEATSATSTPALRVSSRTFTNSATGTYGQAVPDVATNDLQRSLYLTGLESDASYRTNIGIVNRSGAAVPVTLRLIGGSGNTIGTASVTIGPNTFRQDSLATFFPSVNGATYNVLSMRADIGSSYAVSVYASVVDNRTQDPIYVQGAPLPSTSQVIVPSVGHANGINGTFWRSDLTLFNTSASPINVYARYLAGGQDNRNAARKAIFVGSGQTVVVSDLLTSMGFASSGVGALALTWDGGIAPVVSSRTYTTSSTGGTYGQSVDSVFTYGRDAYVVGLRSDFGFRSNAGFVNSGDQTIGVALTLLSSTGQPVATGFVALPPQSQYQASVAALFPAVNVDSLGTFTLQAHTDAAATLFAYGSIVDNVSGDPVFFGGK